MEKIKGKVNEADIPREITSMKNTPRNIFMQDWWLRGILKLKQPPGYSDGTDRVCKLKLDAALCEFGLKKCASDPCLYYNSNKGLIVAIYVDDFLIFFEDVEIFDKLKIFL